LKEGELPWTISSVSSGTCEGIPRSPFISSPTGSVLKAINKLRLPLFDGFALTVKACVNRIEPPCGDSETLLEIPFESIQPLACLNPGKQCPVNPAVKRSVGIEQIGLTLNEFRACLVRTYLFLMLYL
jgi:hypothetical protein